MYQKKVIFLIDIENFSAKFCVILKILQVINSPKYVGITCVFTECIKHLNDPERDMTYLRG